MFRALARAISLALLTACAATPPAPQCPPPTAAPPSPPPLRFTALPPTASAIDFARIAKFPEPGWQVPRSIRFSPDGALVTWLASEAQNDEMSLFALDRATDQISVVLRAKDLPARPRSREEELRRERQRTKTEGITSYRWAKRAPLMVIPHGGDVFVRDAKGALVRLTDTPEPELDPKPCPSGERVAFVRKGELVAVDIATKKEVTLTHGAVEGLTHGLSDFVAQEELGEPSGFFWSPKCDRIAYFEVDERKVGITPVVGYRNDKIDIMQQRYPLAGDANPVVKLFVVDLATKKTTPIRLPDGPERYLVDVAFGEDGKNLYFQALARTHKKVATMRADLGTGAATELFAETSTTWVWPVQTELTAKTNEVVMTSEASGFRHLEVRKLEPNAAPRRLTEGNWEVEQLVAVDEERGRVLFVGTKDGVLERHLYAVPLAGGPITKLTKEPGVHGINSDEHGRAWADTASAHDRLPKVTVVTEAATRELPVTRDDDLAKLGVRPVEHVSFTGPSGDTLYGALLRPRALQPGVKHPAIVMVYGGPNSQMIVDSWAPRLLWQHLADRGFFVLQVDNRGTGGRGVAFERAPHKRLGVVELEDQVAAAKWLAKIPEVDAARIGISGHSYGGFMAALAMFRAPAIFAAGVVGSPVTDWRTYDTGYTERFMETPASNPEGYAASDVTRDVAALIGKLLVMHGQMDENVHYTNTARLIDALVAAKKPFDLLVFPGERHGQRNPASKAYANERIARFFVERL